MADRNSSTRCTITVAGFQPNSNKEVALASFKFTPPISSVSTVPMIHAVLPSSFSKPLNNVTIVQDSKLVALALDDLNYKVSM